MANKITVQMLAEKLATSAGVDKEVAEAFLKAFPETLLASVAQDRLVELDKFGKFYLVAVADRGSVDVNTGAHIVIPGYDKLTFSVDDSIVGQFNETQAAQPKPKPKAKTTAAPAAKKPKTVAAEEKTEPAPVEKTPVEKVPVEKTPVGKTPEPAVEPVQVPEKPVEEKPVEEKPEQKEPVTVQPVEVSPIAPIAPIAPTIPITPITPDSPEPTEGTVAKFFRNLPWWGYVTLVAAVFLIALFIILGASGDGDGNPDGPTVPETQEQVEEKSGSEKKADKPVEKHKVHVLKYGESLTTISVQYYGTPDSMAAIWRLNKFTDPNNIPLGTAIKLP